MKELEAIAAAVIGGVVLTGGFGSIMGIMLGAVIFGIAIIIGIFQVIALIPGVSRAGITITSGRLLGFNRFDSAKISFFLSIPTLAAASLLGIYNIYKEGSAELNFLAIIAVIFSFIFSYFTITLFLNFIKKFSLNIFIIYRIILSLFILGIVYL